MGNHYDMFGNRSFGHAVDALNCASCKTGRFAEKMPSLSDTLKTAAVDTVKNEFISALKKLVDDAKGVVETKKQELASAESDLRAKQEAYDAILAAFPQRGEMYFIASRTRKDGAGHFIEKFKDGKTKCSCEGGRYGGSCWAQSYIQTKGGGQESWFWFSYIGKNNGKGGYTTVESFDRREKPYISTSGGFDYIPLGYKQF